MFYKLLHSILVPAFVTIIGFLFWLLYDTRLDPMLDVGEVCFKIDQFWNLNLILERTKFEYKRKSDLFDYNLKQNTNTFDPYRQNSNPTYT